MTVLVNVQNKNTWRNQKREVFIGLGVQNILLQLSMRQQIPLHAVTSIFSKISFSNVSFKGKKSFIFSVEISYFCNLCLPSLS